jgi:hypothetical protein
MIIDESGNVGIGNATVNATRKVEIVQPSGYDAGLRVMTDGSGAYNQFFSGTSNFRIGSPHNTNALVFDDGASERARIDSSGRLLVGTSSSSANARAVIAGRSDGNPAGTLMIEGTSATPANGDTLAQIRFSASAPSGSNSGAEIGAARDGGTWTNNSSMPTRLAFYTTADGASSPTERLRITSTGQVRLAGAGITFNGDTATANELDDYEEGTWTPALVGTTAVVYANQAGKYVKIGRMVHVQGLLATGSQTFSSTAATLHISGLPFTPNDNTGYTGTTGSVNGQGLNFDAASNTQGASGDYITTGIESGNITFVITTKGTTRGQVRNLGWGASGTGGCICEFEITYYTTA